MTRDTTASERRLTRTQTAIVSLLAVVCILLAGATLVTAQDSQQIYSEDWEESDPLQDYTTNPDGGTITVTDQFADSGDHSLELYSSGSPRPSVTTGDVYDVGSSTPDFYAEFSLRVDSTDGNPDFHPEPSFIVGDGNESISMNGSAGQLSLSGSLVEEAENVDSIPGQQWSRVALEANGSHTILTIDGQQQSVSNVTGQWDDPSNITVGYSSSSDDSDIDATSWFDDVYVSALPPEEEERSEGLRLDVPGYLQHNSSSSYAVEANQSGEWVDVTGQATVTPDNTEALTFYPDNQTVVAGGNKSINERVNVTAMYDGLNATDYTVVATPTVDNLDLLPAWWSVNAVLSDWTMIWVLLATLMATAANRMATTFAGIGAFVMAMIMGWIMGDVPDGIMVTTIFMGLFIGLNLAANIDYSVR